MIIVLCEPDDASAIWLVHRLSVRGHKVRAVLPEELHIGSRLAVRIGNGRALAQMVTANGLVIDENEVSLIINRMQWFPTPQMESASDTDTVYAAEETRAAIVAWCAAFSRPVLSPPLPYAANGNAVSDLHWRCRASAMGIDSAPMTVSGSHQVSTEDGQNQLLMVVGHQVLAPIGETLLESDGEATRALAAVYGPAWFVAQFHRVLEGQSRFLGVPALPVLQNFGEPLIDALSEWMDSQ